MLDAAPNGDDWGYYGIYPPRQLPELASLTALTRLELRNYGIQVTQCGGGGLP